MENLAIKLYKPPETWLELPLKFWLKVMDYLKIQDINNIHLASREFHGIANNYPHHKFALKTSFNSAELIKFSRICDEVKIRFSDVWISDVQTNAISEFFKMTSAHIKKLILVNRRWDEDVLMAILNSVPNIQSLELDYLEVIKRMESKLTVKFPKLEILNVYNVCAANPHSRNELGTNILNRLDCSPAELSFSCYSGAKIENFLQKHKNSLKSLKLSECEDRLPNFKGLKLEHLELENGIYTSLRSLNLGTIIRNDDSMNLNFQDLEGLESLKLKMQGLSPTESFQNLHRLKNLKKLVIFNTSLADTRHTFVQGLTAAVMENLLELETNFSDFSLEELYELSRCLPNLKKFKVKYWNLESFRFLALFKNLEHFTVGFFKYEESIFLEGSIIQPVGKVAVLEIENLDRNLDKKVIRSLAKMFPDLEKFAVISVSNDESVLNILEKFPQLKILRIGGLSNIHNSTVREKSYRMLLNDKFGRDDEEEAKKYQYLPLIRYLMDHRQNLEWIHINYAYYNIKILKNVLKDLKGLRFSSQCFDVTM